MNQPLPLFSLIIPAYREGSHMHASLDVIVSQAESVGEPYEIILVDDGSPDNTWDVLREEANSRQHVRAIRLSRNFGKEAAIAAGLDLAVGEASIVMDADLQHPPTLIPKMIQTWRQTGVNIVEGVKTEHVQQPFHVRLRRKIFYRVMNKLSGFEMDTASDFKLIDSKVRQAWLQMGEKNLFFRGMTAWLGFTKVQLPFVVAERVAGQSGWSFFGLVRLAATALTAFSALPLRLANIAGIIFFVFAAVLGVYSLAVWAAGKAVTGFTTVILLQLIIGSVLFFTLAVMGEYIARIYEEVKGRPRYIVADAIGGQDYKSFDAVGSQGYGVSRPQPSQSRPDACTQQDARIRPEQ